ncbi:BRO family protein [Pseudomonas sp. ZM23]|uniref:BRO family protein n=1 Tax=Pseudomonas triclosanedens TaxID=2961893 RepID=A0ABY7A807_9PSED|nr:BRO family protein [Pseudomonas triclosanedens]MCP8466351.1 BRO family protein [Pseudomonas triclosanedens]MCP8471877.1 BRO family protein [Pseudomonas triclosanedens]MCP8478572.1 BRO family protein [Pseudomonas triclosanedens]WAI52233.1 BRO family protein [Pseudomonas triclosanedens]
MDDGFFPSVFIRNNRPLRATLIDDQAWFVTSDFARLMGQYNEQRFRRRLDEDQWRESFIRAQSGNEIPVELISECAIYALLVYFPHPEQRALRQWISRTVVPALRSEFDSRSESPRRTQLRWEARRINVLEWQNKLWLDIDELPRWTYASRSNPVKRLLSGIGVR